jgi:drug/metabolite transporter (DMT)-like permease
MWAMALALLVLRERLPRTALAGVALSIVGIVVVVSF